MPHHFSAARAQWPAAQTATFIENLLCLRVETGRTGHSSIGSHNSGDLARAGEFNNFVECFKA